MRPLAGLSAVRFAAAARENRLEFWSPSAATWQPLAVTSGLPEASPWARAAVLQGRQQDFSRNPGGAGIDLATLVQSSRASGVLVAATSYIVVENAAQWRMLDLSERRKLGQNAALDFLETPAPPAVWLVAGIAGWLACNAAPAWRQRDLPIAGDQVSS